VTRIWGDVQVKESNAAMWYFTHWETVIFIYYRLQNIYMFYKSEPTVCWLSVLVDLSSFNYVQIILMMLWNDVWMKCVELFLKYLNVSCGWDLNYAK